MASGSILFNTSGYLQGKVEWSSTSNGSSANSSLVRATLYARRTNSATTTGRTWSGYVGIGGEIERINFSSSVAVSSNWVQMATTQRTINHFDDGTRQVTIEGTVTGPSGTSLSGNTSSGSQDVWLDTIPRYAQITRFIVSKNTETSLNIDFGVNETCDKLWYSTNNGNTWTELLNENFVTGGSVVYGLSANTTYNVKIKVRRKDSQLTTESSSVSETTYNYPYITEVQESMLEIGSQQKLSLYNPLSRTVTIKMYKNNTSGTQLYSGTTSGTSISFTPDSNTLYASISNESQASCVYSAIYSSSTKTTTGSYYYGIKNTEAPTFTNFTYQDVNSITTNLTGNSLIIVNGYSNVRATISTSNRAIAKNGATMKEYNFSIGSRPTERADYSSSSSVYMTINNADNATMTVTATDSRNLSTSVTKTATFKNYSDLIIKSVIVTRSNNGTGQSVTLSYNGSYWNQSFGSVTNSITSINYKYKETTSSSWSSGGTSLGVSTSSGNWSGSYSIRGDLGAAGFDVSKSFDIRLTVSDRLSTKTFDLVLTAGTPGIAIYKSKVAIGKKYNTSQGGALQVGGVLKLDDITELNKSSGDVGYYAKRSDTGVEVWMGVGSGGANHGIYSKKLDKWLVYGDNSNVYLNGRAESALYATNSGTATNATNLSNRYSSRPTSINTTPNGDGGLYKFLATSSTTTGKTSKDAHVLNFSWDNTGGWDNQLAITNNYNPHLEVRGQNGSSTWGNWRIIESMTVLYNNSSGSSGTITLNESAANFSHIIIYFLKFDKLGTERASVIISNPNGKHAILNAPHSMSSIGYQLITTTVNINGTTITPIENGSKILNTGTDTNNVSVYNSNEINIDRVEGYY